MDKRKGIRHWFRLLGLFARMDLAWLMRDTKMALLAVLMDVITCVGNVGSILLLAVRFDGIGGMELHEVLFMLSFVVVLSGVFILFGSSNNIHISRRIGRGQLEHMFIQPLPFWVQLTTDGFVPFTGGSKLLVGIAAMAYSIRRLHLTITWPWLVALAASVLISLTIQVALCYLFSTATFYAPVAAEEITSYVLDATNTLGQYPLSGMPVKLQFPLITLFPAGLLAWFPSMALLGKPPLNLPAAYPAILAGLLIAITQYLFRKGWTHYVQKGSNRYLPYGHRS